jgi:cytochrome c oxidase subunit II
VGALPSNQRRRRLLALALMAAVATGLALAPGAFADALTPESGAGSRNADEIDSLYKIVLVIATVVFFGVMGTLLYSLIRFRARKGAVAAQIHGNTNLEIGWTVGAAVILVLLAVVTFSKLPAIKDPARSGPGGLALASGAQFASVDQPRPPDGKSLRITVEGRQFLWRYQYPNGAYSYEEMRVPVDTTVTLRIVATDVAHSWWIPKLGGKFDAIPGYTNWTWFKATREGVYNGQCAELCGRGHANMFGRVRVVPVAEYQAWVEQQKRDIAEANRLQAEQAKQLEGSSSAGAGSQSGDQDAQE